MEAVLAQPASNLVGSRRVLCSHLQAYIPLPRGAGCCSCPSPKEGLVCSCCFPSSALVRLTAPQRTALQLREEGPEVRPANFLSTGGLWQEAILHHQPDTT